MLVFQKIKPLGDRILLKREKEKTSIGGILLPDSAQEKPKEGTIIATGPGRTDKKGELQALSVNKGDKVLFNSYAGVELMSGEEEYIILSESDILGILSE